jgi:transposase InsO family protein
MVGSARIMCGDDLTPEQLGDMSVTLARYARYLSRVVERMHKLNWRKDDPLYQRTIASRDAMMSLVALVSQTHAAKRPRARRPSASFDGAST